MNKRGGYFPHAERWGRKSTWQNLPTALIRVPSILIDRILNYAHTVDNGEDYECQVILTALERFIESERNRPRKGNQHGNEFKTTGRDWTKLNEFEEWVKAKTTQIREGD